MGIRIAANLSQPEITFDRVHLVKLEVKQPLYAKQNMPLRYEVFIEYRLFGIDANGNNHYHPDIIEIEIKDYVTKAMQAASNGDNTLILALTSIESAIASIIANDQGMTTEVV